MKSRDSRKIVLAASLALVVSACGPEPFEGGEVELATEPGGVPQTLSNDDGFDTFLDNYELRVGDDPRIAIELADFTVGAVPPGSFEFEFSPTSGLDRQYYNEDCQYADGLQGAPVSVVVEGSDYGLVWGSFQGYVCEYDVPAYVEGTFAGAKPGDDSIF